jgi:ATP-binding cassette subfamily C (CFTR/MRP) protein 1
MITTGPDRAYYLTSFLSVDSETESIMQSIVEKEFAQQTIISILHRFKFVDRFDRVAVLNLGELVECDTVEVLLGTDSEFRELYTAY